MHTTQSLNILSILANAVANFNGKITESKKQADLLLRELSICLFDGKLSAIQSKYLAAHLTGFGFEEYSVGRFIQNLRELELSGHLTRHTAKSKEAEYKVNLFLQLANQKQAAIETAAYDAEMADIAKLPAIAPLVAAVAKSRELIGELADCNEARFFEICNEVEQIENSNHLVNPINDIISATKDRNLNAASFIYNSGYISLNIKEELIFALRHAADRLSLFLMYNENGKFMNAECEENKGYSPFCVMSNVIGWVLKKQPTPTTEPRKLIKSDNCLNLQNAAKEAGLDSADYLDLYPESGDFGNYDIEETCIAYQKAEAIDESTDNDAPCISDLFVFKFIEFLLPRASKKIEAVVEHNEKIGVKIYDYEIGYICDKNDKNYPIALRVVGRNNCYLRFLHRDLALAYPNHIPNYIDSPTVRISDLNYFQTFYSKEMHQFFRDIFRQLI